MTKRFIELIHDIRPASRFGEDDMCKSELFNEYITVADTLDMLVQICKQEIKEADKV